MEPSDLPRLPPCEPPRALAELVLARAKEELRSASSPAAAAVRLPLSEQLSYGVALFAYSLYAAAFALRLLIAAG